MRNRAQAIEVVAPIIEEMESRHPETVIAQAVINAYEALPDPVYAATKEFLTAAVGWREWVTGGKPSESWPATRMMMAEKDLRVALGGQDG